MSNAKINNKLNRISWQSNALFNVILLFFALACIIPFLIVIGISITDEESIRKVGYQIIPSQLSNKAYLFLWNERATILQAAGVSLGVTVVGTVLGVMLTALMGYVMSRPDYILKPFLIWLVFVPMIFSGGLVASYVINIRLLNLKNSYWALILPMLVSSFNVTIAKTFFRTTIPDSIIESAKIDGASQLRIFRTIVLPVSLPVLATLGLFMSFAYWNDWFLSMLYISDKSKYSLQYLLQQIVMNIEYLAKNPALGASAQEYVNSMPKESVRMAIAVVIVLPIALAYPFFQKYFVSGLTIGAVKG